MIKKFGPRSRYERPSYPTGKGQRSGVLDVQHGRFPALQLGIFALVALGAAAYLWKGAELKPRLSALFDPSTDAGELVAVEENRTAPTPSVPEARAPTVAAREDRIEPQQAAPNASERRNAFATAAPAAPAQPIVAPFSSVDLAEFRKGRELANAGNFKPALAKWLPLAERGHSDSQFSIGRLYARGDGVARDLKKARTYFEQAAKQGHGRAAYSLGLMYEAGDGVPRDKNLARSHYEQALGSGYDEARQGLTRLKQAR